MWPPAITLGLIAWSLDPPTLSNAALSVLLIATFALAHRVRNIGLGDGFVVGALAVRLARLGGTASDMGGRLGDRRVARPRLLPDRHRGGTPSRTVLEAERPYVLSPFSGAGVTVVTLRFAVSGTHS